jgi:TolB-like protein/DNA-binding winged helix-turn-helix (wHTH) protein/Flp pilus assembly protein TadD
MARLNLNATPISAFRFGVFELDLKSGELRKAGISIGLPPQPFKILALLASHAGELVSREEVQQQIWGSDTFVDFDQGLNFAIKKIRGALGDDAETPRYIETLPRRGYRFIAPVEKVADGTTGVTEFPQPNHDAAPIQAHVGDAAGPGIAAASRSDEMPRTEPYTQRTHLRYTIALAVGAIVALGIVLVGLNSSSLRPRFLTGPTSGQIQSIAVLPLENLSGDPAQEFFADGITDALITDMAQIGALRVISRTSVMRYKGTKKSLPEIARELNVDAIVEGSVVRSGNRVRITGQLVQAATDRHLWAKNYESELTNIVTLQSDVARAIATEVQAKLTPHELMRLANIRTVKPEAYEAYLMGRYLLNKRNEEALKKGSEYFLQSIENDPTYAQAYVGLADSYVVLAYHEFEDPREAYPKAKAATLKALELDPELAEAHATLAAIMAAYEWNYSGGETEFKRAIELNPNYAIAHSSYSVFLANKGRFDEATAQIRRAHELDPLSLIISMSLGQQLYFQRRFDEAIDGLRKVLVLDPNFMAYVNLGGAYEQKAMYREAIREFQKAVTISQGNPECLEGLAHAYAISGDRIEAIKVLNELNGLSKRRYVSAYSRVVIYVGLGEKEQAFAWLERAYREHASRLAFLKVDPRLDPLRSDARFREILRRIGIP